MAVRLGPQVPSTRGNGAAMQRTRLPLAASMRGIRRDELRFWREHCMLECRVETLLFQPHVSDHPSSIRRVHRRRRRRHSFQDSGGTQARGQPGTQWTQSFCREEQQGESLCARPQHPHLQTLAGRRDAGAYGCAGWNRTSVFPPPSTWQTAAARTAGVFVFKCEGSAAMQREQLQLAVLLLKRAAAAEDATLLQVA